MYKVFIYPRWCRISSINSISRYKDDRHQQVSPFTLPKGDNLPKIHIFQDSLPHLYSASNLRKGLLMSCFFLQCIKVRGWKALRNAHDEQHSPRESCHRGSLGIWDGGLFWRVWVGIEVCWFPGLVFLKGKGDLWSFEKNMCIKSWWLRNW